MARCIAHTKNGCRCLRRSLSSSDFCAQHNDQISTGESIAHIAGAIIGNVLLPGGGGALIGFLAAPPRT